MSNTADKEFHATVTIAFDNYNIYTFEKGFNDKYGLEFGEVSDDYFQGYAITEKDFRTVVKLLSEKNTDVETFRDVVELIKEKARLQSLVSETDTE